ncbi:ParB/RepB/Spo0J family partition protein [Thalassovita sp.]|uniref:ParB/RepB/Spo0J family partition protein n=1 Tax=Thalassovita sp. TaxID=1979401 RepID=UPI002B2744A7|nr:ParB/RepB/Spo0J family partition protein [Thalassovita sp.]
MTTERFFDLPVEQIRIPEDRARDLDLNWAEALAGIIRTQGLTNPITVRHAGDHYELVTGLHRLAAFKALGSEAIPCQLSSATSDDEARLEEVMENLGRAELTALDRCHHLYELKQAWERLYPEAGHGGDRKSIKRQSLPLDQKPQEIFGFAAANAEKIGLSQRTIRMAVSIWTGLAPASRARLTGTELARKQTELKALSDQGAMHQQRILDLIQDVNSDVSNVAGAIQALAGTGAKDAVERKVASIRSGLASLPDEAFDRLLNEEADRVIASLKRMGRI